MVISGSGSGSGLDLDLDSGLNFHPRSLAAWHWHWQWSTRIPWPSSSHPRPPGTNLQQQKKVWKTKAQPRVPNPIGYTYPPLELRTSWWLFYRSRWPHRCLVQKNCNAEQGEKERKKDILTSSKAKFGPWDKWFTKKMGYLPIHRK